MRDQQMPEWKPEIRRRLAGLQLEPPRVNAIVEELAQHLEDFSAKKIFSRVAAFSRASRIRSAKEKTNGQPR